MLKPHPLLLRLTHLVKRGAISYTDVAHACGVTESAARAWVRRDRPPQNKLSRAALDALIAAAEKMSGS